MLFRTIPFKAILFAATILLVSDKVVCAPPDDADPNLPERYYPLIQFLRNTTDTDFVIPSHPLDSTNCDLIEPLKKEEHYACRQYIASLPTIPQAKRIAFWINRKFSLRNGTARIRTPVKTMAFVPSFKNDDTFYGNPIETGRWVDVYELNAKQGDTVEKWLFKVGLGCFSGRQDERCVDWLLEKETQLH